MLLPPPPPQLARADARAGTMSNRVARRRANDFGKIMTDAPDSSAPARAGGWRRDHSQPGCRRMAIAAPACPTLARRRASAARRGLRACRHEHRVGPVLLREEFLQGSDLRQVEMRDV